MKNGSVSENTSLEKITALAKRRGFIYPGSEIYGGLNGFYDFGPLGVEMKFNIKQAWWKEIVQKRDDVVGLSAALIMNPKAWEASGHVEGFSDPLVECPECHKRFRGDGEDITDGRCPECGKDISRQQSRQFNLMFKTNVGATEESASVAYLRPETAGGIFTNFKNIVDTMRVKIPFGIAQIGKAFRNEVNPKDYIFRTREFEQMELEFFVRPSEDEKWFDTWVMERMRWYEGLGLNHIRKFEQPKEELAHYSKRTIDVEYQFPFGWKEIEGIANRTDFDLKAHSKYSGEDLSYFSEKTGERFTPYVIEPSAGVDRIMLAFLCDAYNEDEKGGEKRVVLKLHPKIAPIKAAILPLVRKDEALVKIARDIYVKLREQHTVHYDESGSIGRRYRRHDEIGTPVCVTVDSQTLKDKTVTLRDRDTLKQERVQASEVIDYINQLL